MCISSSINNDFQFQKFIILLLLFEELRALHSIVKKLVVTYTEMISKVLCSSEPFLAFIKLLFLIGPKLEIVNCLSPLMFLFIFFR